MNNKLLNELLDETDEVADKVNLKLIAARREHDELSAEKAEAAQAAYEFLAAAKAQGLTNADLSKLEWASVAVEAFATRRQAIEQRIDALVALQHGEVRCNLSRLLDKGPLVREADPEFERLLAEEYDAEMRAAEEKAQRDRVRAEAAAAAQERDARLAAQSGVVAGGWPITDAERAALLKAIAGWDGYDRETGETDYDAEDLLRGIAKRLKAGAQLVIVD